MKLLLENLFLRETLFFTKKRWVNCLNKWKSIDKIAGKEVVQLYLTDLYGSVTRPNKQLKGFEKVLLNPGETKTISFKLNKEHLSFIGQQNKRIVEPGEFLVSISDDSAKFILK